MTHTPGPWRYRGSLGPQSNPHLLGPHVIESATGIQIAILNGWRSELSEVNARLIAAAPALLEALDAMLTHMGMDEDDWNKPTFDQARSAIAAAKGDA
jgi:hypothetical protein